MIECPHFRKCGAPLCPLDPESLRKGIWYPDEPICHKRPTPGWVKAQKKIRRKTKNVNRYFTFEMLNQNCIIGKGMVGLNPDIKKDEEEQLKQWLKKHPPKKTLSAAERDKARQRMLRIRKKKRAI
ncbi:MAG: hypothetical protein ACTSPB_02010 [Candidatus Thorarchaeota archaeon]